MANAESKRTESRRICHHRGSRGFSNGGHEHLCVAFSTGNSAGDPGWIQRLALCVKIANSSNTNQVNNGVIKEEQ